MDKKIKVSVIYVYYNTPQDLTRSVTSLLDNSQGVALEIIIVDNNSPKKIPSSLERRKGVRIIKAKKNAGFGAGCNIGAKAARGVYLLFLNPDTLVYQDAIHEMLKTLKNTKVGIVGPKMVSEKGSTLPTISTFLTFPKLLVVYSFLNTIFKYNPVSKRFWLLSADRDKEQRVDVLSGACLMLKKTVFEKIDGFDERFFMYFEEHDLCIKVKKAGLKAIYNPKAKITHLIGRSLNDKRKIKKYFQESRFLYSKKHFGFKKAIISEFFLRYITTSNIFAALTFIFSLFLNTYKQDRLMLLIGDAARDFLAARDMLLTQTIPLVGIPSSVPWLHQGPISVYGIGLAFLLSKFNPIAPGILFGIVGAITTVFVYSLTKKYLNDATAVIAALLYATSPMVVVNARMPYHTSLIPFFSIVFFFVFAASLKKPKILPYAFFAFGLLMQVELSNIVVFAIMAVLLYINKTKISRRTIYASVLSFMIGIVPFILYELFYGPSYIKFPLWIVNRIRLFFGLTLHHSSTTSSLPNALSTIYQQISGTIFPQTHIVGLFIFLVSLFFLIAKSRSKYEKGFYPIILLWITIPLIAFSLHASPGTAYFGLLYPAIIMLIAIFFDELIRINKMFFLFIVFIVCFNSLLLIKNDFFVSSEKGAHPMPPTYYNFGISWKLSDDVSKAIVLDAGEKSFRLLGKGGLTLYKTSIDPYVYLVWFHGGKISDTATLVYEIYPPRTQNLTAKKIIFRGEGGIVVKNE